MQHSNGFENIGSVPSEEIGGIDFIHTVSMLKRPSFISLVMGKGGGGSACLSVWGTGGVYLAAMVWLFAMLQTAAAGSLRRTDRVVFVTSVI